MHLVLAYVNLFIVRGSFVLPMVYLLACVCVSMCPSPSAHAPKTNLTSRAMCQKHLLQSNVTPRLMLLLFRTKREQVTNNGTQKEARTDSKYRNSATKLSQPAHAKLMESNIPSHRLKQNLFQESGHILKQLLVD